MVICSIVLDCYKNSNFEIKNNKIYWHSIGLIYFSVTPISNSKALRRSIGIARSLLII